MNGGPIPPIIDIDDLPDRQGWVVITMTGSFETPVMVQVLGYVLVELFDDGIDTITIDARRCTALAETTCQVIVDAARHAHELGGCLVAAGLTSADRARLRRHDAERHLVLAG